MAVAVEVSEAVGTSRLELPIRNELESSPRWCSQDLDELGNERGPDDMLRGIGKCTRRNGNTSR